MAYRLQPGIPAGRQLKRIARAELATAARLLLGPAEARGEAVHEARKSIKKVRAILRLLRDPLGDLYQPQTHCLRDIGRTLSEVRDAAGVLETFDAMCRLSRSPRPAALAGLRRRLVQRRRRCESTAAAAAVAREAARELREVWRTAAAWPVDHVTAASLVPAAVARYRVARRTLASLGARPGPTVLHEWRKQVKEHWYQVRLFAGIEPNRLDPVAEALREVGTALGEDHNLALLCAFVKAATPAERDAVLNLARTYRRELRCQALDSGRKIFRDKPHHWASELARM